MTLPDDLPVRAITLMLGTEAAAAFDELTRKQITEGLNTWPATFRQGQFVPAVEYIRAARVRTKLMHAMAERMAKVDLYVGSGQDLPITNLTGHPTVVFPMGFRDRDGRDMPGSVIAHRPTLRRVDAARRRPRLPAGHRRPSRGPRWSVISRQGSDQSCRSVEGSAALHPAQARKARCETSRTRASLSFLLMVSIWALVASLTFRNFATARTASWRTSTSESLSAWVSASSAVGNASPTFPSLSTACRRTCGSG